MEEEKTEGLLLQTIPYLGKQKILKIFTPNNGLISLMAKQGIPPSLTTPFLVAEWVYEKGKKELYSLKDTSLLNDLSSLRQDYSILSAAGQIAQDLLSSQFPERKAPLLYALTLSYFQKLTFFSHLETCVASFRLKRLLHEGVLSLQDECINCGKKASRIQRGESVCKDHDQGQSIPFSHEEWAVLSQLVFARQFSALQDLSLTAALQKKIEFMIQISDE